MIETLFLIKGDFLEKNIEVEKMKHEKNEIIALDYESHKKLNLLNIKHIKFEKFLKKDDFKMIDEHAFKINTNWYKNSKVEKFLTFEKINLGNLLEQEFFTYLLPTITNFVTLIKIREQMGIPKQIIISNELTEMAKIIFLNVEIISIDSIKEELFGFDKYTIKYNIGPFPISIRLSRKKFFAIQKFYEKTFLLMYNKLFSKINTENSILLIDFDASKENEFLKQISKKGKNIFLLNRRRSAIWNFKSFKTIKNTKSIPISYEQFLNKYDKNEIKKSIKNIEEKLDLLLSDKELFSNLFSIQNISFWNHIQKHFKNYCQDRFRESIYEIIGSRKLLTKIKPSAMLHFFGIALQEKIIIQEALKQNIIPMMLQHGAPYIFSSRWPELNPVVGTLPVHDEKIAVWGNMMKDYAIENGMKEENVIVSGSIRHDPYFKIENKYEEKGIILVALMPYVINHSYHLSISEYEKYEEALEILCITLKKIKNRNKIFKLHPSDHGFNSKIMKQVIYSIDPSSKIIIQGELTKIIPAAELVITVGLTTFLLDSNIFKKPTITLMYNHQEFLNKLCHGYTKLFEYTDKIKFEEYIHKILKKQDIRKENIHKGTEFVNSYLSNQGISSECLIKEIFKS
jgi:hypothetical protein